MKSGSPFLTIWPSRKLIAVSLPPTWARNSTLSTAENCPRKIVVPATVACSGWLTVTFGGAGAAAGWPSRCQARCPASLWVNNSSNWSITNRQTACSGGLAAVSAGIAEALITTAFGLLVAIPAVWIYNFFQTKIDFLTVEMTYSGKELIDYMIKNVGAEFGRSSFTKDFPAQVASGSGHINK